MVTTERRIEVTSPAQQRAWLAGERAPAEEVRPGLWAVCVPMASQGMPWTLSYAILGEGVHLVDPGWHLDGNLSVWEAFLEERGRTLQDVQTVLVTHTHIDHVGLAEAIRERSGARVLMSAVERSLQDEPTVGSSRSRDVVDARLRRWGVPNDERVRQIEELTRIESPPIVTPDETFSDGDLIELEGFTLQAVLTPGHTNGHACFVDESAGFIMTGDHVLPDINPGLGLGTRGDTDPLTDYMASLQRMAEFDACEVLPGHEWRFTGLAVRSANIATHHLRRTRALAALIPELGDTSVWEYAARSPWSRGWGNMTGIHLHSALAQTEFHLASIRSGLAAEWLDHSW